MKSGIFELVVGVIMVVVPEPATTATGVLLIGSGIKKISDNL